MGPVSLTKRGAVALVTIDNPPVNALSHGVREGSWNAVESAEAKDQTRAIVIGCEGRIAMFKGNATRISAIA